MKALYEFYVLHDREIPGGKIWRHNVPEVFCFDQQRGVKVSKELQWFIFRMNNGHTEKELRENPSLIGTGMTENGFTGLCGSDTAFTNYKGFPGRKNYITGEDLNKPDLVQDKTRVCGGAIIRLEKVGPKFILQCLDATKPLPPIDELIEMYWLWFTAVTVRPDGSNGRFPQNQQSKFDVKWPIFSNGLPITVKPNSKVVNKPYARLKYLRTVWVDS